MSKFNNRVDAETFIRAYLDSNCDVVRTAQGLGVHTSGVRERVKRYRKAGVKLPVQRKNGNALDIEALNKLIKSLRG